MKNKFYRIIFISVLFATVFACGVKAPPLPPEGREREEDEAIVALQSPSPSPEPSPSPLPAAKKKKKKRTQ